MSDHNSEEAAKSAALADHARLIRDKLELAKSYGLDSVQAYAHIGMVLIRAKEQIGASPKGAFGKWCDDAGFGFSKEWRARLMRLATYWDGYQVALRWATEKLGIVPGRKEYSVDGALTLTEQWFTDWSEGFDPAGVSDEIAKLAADFQTKAAERETRSEERKAAKEEAEAEEAESKAKAESEAETLRRELAKALAEIERLKAALRKAQGKPDEEPKAETKQGPSVSSEIRGRAKRVYAVTIRAEQSEALRNERAAARGRLGEMSVKAGYDSLKAFILACGLDWAAYETQWNADTDEAMKDAA